MTRSDTEFCFSDQLRFARLSGDFNPLHLDPLAARRYLFGGVVVHGVHVLLRALDRLAEIRDSHFDIFRIRACFRAPVTPGMRLQVQVSDVSADKIKVQVSFGESIVLDGVIEFAEPESESCQVDCEGGVYEVEQPARVQTVDWGSERGQTELGVNGDLCCKMFPSVTRRVEPVRIAMLLACTRIVGMQCPGMNSVFSELDVNFKPASAGRNLHEATYCVDAFDERFGLLKIGVRCAFGSATLRAFLRPEPAEQIAVSNLAGVVDRLEFAGQRALVVGGSRGLGEVAAKVLGVGGAEVVLTYHTGQADAEKVAEEIRQIGGMARTVQFSSTMPVENFCELLEGWAPTQLLYFASPPILRLKRKPFDAALFQDFCQTYLTTFSDLVLTLQSKSPLTRVVYPSTIFVDDPPREFVEYAAAKSAGEVLCAAFSKRFPATIFRVSRLPRLQTDQTNSITGPKSDDPLPFVLDLLR